MTITEAQLARMSELQSKLKEAADAYYNRDIEIMTNFEYDALYDELLSLEAETGYIMDGSITQGVGSDVTETDLPKVEHASPMLSLGKTKSRDELVAWLGSHVGCLSYKLDGSTVVLTYMGGRLSQAVTRGNGLIGEDITAQARKFACVPEEIPFEGELVVRGEALMTYSEFERVNALQGEGDKYKNPRNLASGTMRALDTSLLDERTVEFHPFTLVTAEGRVDNSYTSRLDWLNTLGFSSVDHFEISGSVLLDKIAEIEAGLEAYDLPSDGLVLFFDDVEYGDSLGSTAHHPRNGIAFKWQDETAKTKLTGVLWSPSRTGRLNPVALFEPVELEGTTVSKASLHNVTVMEETLGRAYIGQEVTVYKANMIIPVVLTGKPADSADEEWLDVPDYCPVCGEPTERKVDNDSVFLVCPNDACPAKDEGAFTHFVSREAMNIMGLSKETLGKMIEAGVVTSFADILALPNKHDEVVGVIEGIKEKSFANIAAAVEAARKTEARRFLNALGIREIGRNISRDICQAYGNDINALIDDIEAGNMERIDAVPGVGEVMLVELRKYFSKNASMVRDLLTSIEITDLGEATQTEENDFVSGRTFVITGEVAVFENRDAFKAFVEANGGKVSGSVSGKTSYLVTNDPGSGSSKNRKAQELGVPIITEEQFCEMSGYGG